MPPRPDPPRIWDSVLHPLPGYHYFEPPPPRPVSHSISWLSLMKASLTADAAMLAYGHNGSRRMTPIEFDGHFTKAGFADPELVGDWGGGPLGTQGFFARHDNFAILSFRGTEPDDPIDIAYDADVFLVPEIHGASESKVHQGFQRALEQVWGQVEPKLTDYRNDSKNSDNEIFFTGHSLGAAIATLAFSRFNDPRTSLYTYGSPRVGNEAFVNSLRARPSLGLVRFVDNNDIVTRVPPAIPLWGYEHIPWAMFQILPNGQILDCTSSPNAQVSNLIQITQDLTFFKQLALPITANTFLPDDVYDHSPGCYCNRIWNHL